MSNCSLSSHGLFTGPLNNSSFSDLVGNEYHTNLAYAVGGGGGGCGGCGSCGGCNNPTSCRIPIRECNSYAVMNNAPPTAPITEYRPSACGYTPVTINRYVTNATAPGSYGTNVAPMSVGVNYSSGVVNPTSSISYPGGIVQPNINVGPVRITPGTTPVNAIVYDKTTTTPTRTTTTAIADISNVQGLQPSYQTTGLSYPGIHAGEPAQTQINSEYLQTTNLHPDYHPYHASQLMPKVSDVKQVLVGYHTRSNGVPVAHNPVRSVQVTNVPVNSQLSGATMGSFGVANAIVPPISNISYGGGVYNTVHSVSSNNLCGGEIPQFSGNESCAVDPSSPYYPQAVASIPVPIEGGASQTFPVYACSVTVNNPHQAEANYLTANGLQNTTFINKIQRNPITGLPDTVPYGPDNNAVPPGHTLTTLAHGRLNPQSANGGGHTLYTNGIHTPRLMNGHESATITETYMEYLASSCCSGAPPCIPPYVFIILRGPSKKGTFNYCTQTEERGEFYYNALYVNGICGNTIYLEPGHRYYFGYYKKAACNCIEVSCCDEDELVIATNFKTSPKTQIQIYRPFEFVLPCGNVCWLRIPKTWCVPGGGLYLTSILYVGCAVPILIPNNYTIHL